MATRGIPFSGLMVRALLDGFKTQTRRLVNPQPIRGIVALDDMEPNSGGFLIDQAIAATELQPKAPYALGDRLWVREAFQLPIEYDRLSGVDAAAKIVASLGRSHAADLAADPEAMGRVVPVRYVADGATSAAWAEGMTPGRVRIPRYMPRWSSRITSAVTRVRFERVASITEADAIAEGARLGEPIAGVWKGEPDKPARLYSFGDNDKGEPQFAALAAAGAFSKLWDSLHGDPETGWAANPWVAAYDLKTVVANIDRL